MEQNTTTTTRRAVPGWKVIRVVDGELTPRPVTDWVVRAGYWEDEPFEPFIEVAPAPALEHDFIFLERPDGTRDLWSISSWKDPEELLAIFAEEKDREELRKHMDGETRKDPEPLEDQLALTAEDLAGILITPSMIHDLFERFPEELQERKREDPLQRTLPL